MILAVAGRFLQNLAKSVPQAAQVEVLPDPEISLGGCIVRSSHGQLDQQLETQLTTISRATAMEAGLSP
jgi:flagellar biosynthesis/type III secretory pathway protein FliH